MANDEIKELQEKLRKQERMRYSQPEGEKGRISDPAKFIESHLPKSDRGEKEIFKPVSEKTYKRKSTISKEDEVTSLKKELIVM